MTKKELNETVVKLENLISTAEKYKNAWFFKPAEHASARRYEEKKGTVDYFEWEEGGHAYSGEYNVSCSCKNVYAYGSYHKDGKKTTLLAVKNSYKRLKEQLDKAC